MAGIVPTIKVQARQHRGKLGERVSAKKLALGVPKRAWRPGRLLFPPKRGKHLGSDALSLKKLFAPARQRPQKSAIRRHARS